jgi:23S rRNA pseudouridine2605 synthase
MAEERLQKIIARAGFASRREAESLISEGKVTVNGRVVTELGTKADPERDHVKVDGKLITREETKRYILLYKPREVMTTAEDPEGRKTVIDLVKGVRERLFPVGRLDFHSEGLIILTNDGDLAYKVAHPSQGSVKTYNVKVRGVPDERIVDKLRRGIHIDGRRTLPCEIDRLKTTGKTEDEGNSWFEVRLREGRTQQIRKMFQAVGHPVSKLKRVAIGPISDKKLMAGDYRELTPQEVKLLYQNPEAREARQRRTTRPAAPRPATTPRPAATRVTKRTSVNAAKKKSSSATPRAASTASRGGAPPKGSGARTPAARRRNG